MKQRRFASLTLCVALGVAAIVICGRGQAARVEAQAVREDKVLFVSNRDGERKFNIFTMNPDGSQQTNLTKFDGIELDPAWSPDGKRIAFVALASPQATKADIYVMNADGSQRKRLTQNEEGTLAFASTWSPDGKQIAFSTMQVRDGNVLKVSLEVMDADGKDRKRLGEDMALPAWSPDGQKILYTVIKGQGAEEVIRLYVMNSDGSNAQALTGKDVKAGMGAWSPDGKRIAYISGEDQVDIYVMNADGSQPMRLTKTEQEMEFGPQWSADGKRIFFSQMPRGAAASSSRKKSDIYAMDADGKNVKQLTNNSAFDVLGGSGLFLLER